MTSREQIKQLRDEIGYRDFRIAALQNKIRNQEEELKKIVRLKSELSTLRKKNKALTDENVKLQNELKDKKHSKVVGFQSSDQKKQIEDLKWSLDDARIDDMNSVLKIAELKAELDLTKKGLIHISPYGEIPKDIYEQIQSLERQLSITNENYQSVKDHYDAIKAFLEDEEQLENAEKYLDGYFPTRRGARQKISSEKIETIRKLHEGGMSIRDIAAAVEVSVGSVHRYLKMQ